jgi:hypothetical protein
VKFLVVLTVILVLAAAGTTWYALVNSTRRDVTFRVTDKTVKFDSSHNSQYLIFTNRGVFKDTDSLLYFKFRSSDLYGSLERGRRYTCKVVGWRIGLFSEYPNLIKCHNA